MPRLSKKDYPHDKKPGGPLPAYPDKAYHPLSRQNHDAGKIVLISFNPDPPHSRPGKNQPQPQPQPQII